MTTELPMTKNELNAMPKALRILAAEITAPDHVPAMCLRDAAAMIESLRWAIETTITENLHLADGDNCTLKRIKDAVSFSLPSENAPDETPRGTSHE